MSFLSGSVGGGLQAVILMKRRIISKVHITYLSTLIIVYNVFMLSGSVGEGLQVVILMKRRIINEILTTYLPTLLILIIVYSTNFFKA